MIPWGAGFDCETRPFRAGVQAPPSVSLQWAEIKNNGVTRPMLLGGAGAYGLMLETFKGWLRTPGFVLIGANTAYDMLCMVTLEGRIHGYESAEELLKEVFSKYRANEVTDVLTRQKMLDLAAGRYRGYFDHRGKWRHYGYALDDVTLRHTGRQLEKNVWEKKYGDLEEVPLSQWPEGAVAYALNDGLSTSQVAVEQETYPAIIGENFPGLDPLRDQYNQVRAGFWLKLMSTYGLRTEPEAVYKFAREVRQEFFRLANELADTLIPPLEGCPIHTPMWIKASTALRCVCMPLVTREFTLERKKIVSYVEKLGRLPAITSYGPLGEAKITLKAESLIQINDPVLGLCAVWPKIKAGCEEKEPRALEAFAFLEEAGLAACTFHRSTKAAATRMIEVCRMLNREPKRTEPTDKFSDGNIALDRETCEQMGDPLLSSFATLTSLTKTQSNDIPALLTGVYYPIHTRFEEYLATNRTSSSNPNVQNPPRLPGMRECIVPRPGCVFVDGDYKQLELFSLAQLCLWKLGWSKLAESLRANLDAHGVVGATMAGCTYEHLMNHLELDAALKNFRDCGKVANFGIPGGLGPDTLVMYAAKSYGVKITRDRAVEIKEAFFSAFPEMRDYFRYVNSLESYAGSGSYNVVDPYSGRLRADATFCAASNDGFQGLGANVAKLAGWLIAEACYVSREDPLFGCRPVNFVHDQWLIEAREDRANGAAKSLAYHMDRAARQVLPDCPTTASVLLSRVWSKKAKKIEVNGWLIPWEPEKKLAA